MKKKILSTILLITIIIFGVFIGFKIFKKSEISEKSNAKAEKMVEIDNNSNENVNIEEENKEINVEKEEEVITEIIEEKNKATTSSASNSKTSQSAKSTSSKKTESKTTNNQKQEVQTETKSSDKKEEQPSSTPTPSPKEEPKTTAEPKKEEPSKTTEITVEVPDSNTYKNDPAFIKLQKELFKTFKECNDVGEKEWRKDKANVSNIYCEAEYYKGAEAGIRLYIVYNDKTWKKYSR